MNKNITSPSGLKLLTAGKYCNQDITVIPVLQEKSTTENGEVTADSGYAGLGKVTVNVASGAELNIAYGDTAPEDTTKLWVEGADPSKVIATNQMNGSETPSLVNAYLPVANDGLSSVNVGKYIYTFGGHNKNGFATRICKFDTDTKTLTVLSTALPSGRGYTSCAVVGTNIYIFGGQTGTSSGDFSAEILKFDTVTEMITTLSATINGYARTSCAVVGTNIYLFGGLYSSTSNRNTIQKFDTVTETITTLSATLYDQMHSTSCVSVGTDIYIFGGQKNYSSSADYFNTIQKFDTVTEMITTLSAYLPYGIYGMGCCVIGLNIYLFGGRAKQIGGSTYYTLNTIQKFDTVTETITTLSATLPNALWYVSCASVGTNIYLFGGTSGSSTYYNTIYEFAVSVPLPQNQLLLNTTLNKNLFKIINAESAEIEIGVNAVYRGNANNIAELETACVFDTNQYAWVNVQSGAVVEKLASVVTITSQASDYAFNVYDGTNTSGNLVATLGGANGALTAKVPCFSGYLYFQNTNASTAWEGFTVASNMTVTGGTDNYQLVQVNGDGAISATVVEVSAGFTVQMSTTGNGATVYDGQTASGAGVAINGTAKEVTCTSGYLLVTFGSSYYYSSGYDITGSITGQTITYSGSGYNDVALLFTVGSDGSILNISVSLD